MPEVKHNVKNSFACKSLMAKDVLIVVMLEHANFSCLKPKSVLPVHVKAGKKWILLYLAVGFMVDYLFF